MTPTSMYHFLAMVSICKLVYHNFSSKLPAKPNRTLCQVLLVLGLTFWPGLGLSLAYAANPSATIRDAWWSNQADADHDGCWEPTGLSHTARLNWDVDVVGGGSLTVYEKIYYMPSRTNTWLLYRTNASHSIGGTTTNDYRYLDVILNNGLCLPTDYRIEVYQVGLPTPDYIRDRSNDADLNAHHEEWPCEPKARISDAWWSNQTDTDGNGCFESTARLNWDVDVSCGTAPLTVFEKIYFKLSSSNSWLLYGTNASHVITGMTTNDAQFIQLDLDSGNCNAWDYRIEVYQPGNFLPDNTRSPLSDPDLASHREEAPPCPAIANISSIWWTNRVDNDHDGCFEGPVRLCWDADENCGRSLRLYEKVYYRATGNNGWTLYATNPPHLVIGANTEDFTSLSISLPNASCQGWDFKIELYRDGQTVPDEVRDSTMDPELSAQASKALQPDLKISRSQDQVVLSWETNWVGFSLQYVSNWVPPIAWTADQQLPSVLGNRYAVTNSASAQSRFYRLNKQ